MLLRKREYNVKKKWQKRKLKKRRSFPSPLSTACRVFFISAVTRENSCAGTKILKAYPGIVPRK
jgi:hypothetical protein